MNRNFAGSLGTGGAPVAGDTSLPIDPLLNDRETAKLLGCGRSTLWRWVAQEIFPPPLKIGGLSRWRQSEALAVIDKAAAERKAA